MVLQKMTLINDDMKKYPKCEYLKKAKETVNEWLEANDSSKCTVSIRYSSWNPDNILTLLRRHLWVIGLESLAPHRYHDLKSASGTSFK